MATTNIIDMVKSLCKLYKGGGASDNPYKPEEADETNWASEYLKYQIWDAEYSVVHNFSWWFEVWQLNYPKELSDKQDKAEEVYKLAISDKLKKMHRDDIDFQAMYLAL